MTKLRQQEFVTFSDPYAVRIGEREFFLKYEELVEILAAIRDTPNWGNEYFLSARSKAVEIMNFLPESEY